MVFQFVIPWHICFPELYGIEKGYNGKDLRIALCTWELKFQFHCLDFHFNSHFVALDHNNEVSCSSEFRSKELAVKYSSAALEFFIVFSAGTAFIHET